MHGALPRRTASHAGLSAGSGAPIGPYPVLGDHGNLGRAPTRHAPLTAPDPEGTIMSVDTRQASALLTDDELRTLDAHWRAANYLCPSARSTSWPTPC